MPEIKSRQHLVRPYPSKAQSAQTFHGTLPCWTIFLHSRKLQLAMNCLNSTKRSHWMPPSTSVLTVTAEAQLVAVTSCKKKNIIFRFC